MQSYNPAPPCDTVWAVPLSLATTHRITIVFSSYGYLDVSVPHVRYLQFSSQIEYLSVSGFSHSDIHGSMLVCSSPQLFAAYHVLRRLQEPRHPPYALICFLFFTNIARIVSYYRSYSIYLKRNQSHCLPINFRIRFSNVKLHLY